MRKYRKVTAEEIPKLPIGERVKGIFQTYVGFKVGRRHKLCIGPSTIILPEYLYRKYIKTVDMLERLALYLESNSIRSRVRGVIVKGDPMPTIDEDGEYIHCSPCLLAETFNPEGGLEKAIDAAKKLEIFEYEPIVIEVTK